MRQNILTGVLALGFAVFAFVPGVGAQGNPNEQCSEGYELLAKYEYKGEVGYVAESGGDVVEVSGNADEGQFKVLKENTVVYEVIVFGGADTDTDVYPDGVTEGTFDNSELKNPGEQTPDISNVQFCGGAPKDDEDNGENGDGQNGGVTNGVQDDVDEVEENGQVLSDQVDAPVSGEGVDAGGGAVVGAAAGLLTSLSGLGYGIRRFVKSE